MLATSPTAVVGGLSRFWPARPEHDAPILAGDTCSYNLADQLPHAPAQPLGTCATAQAHHGMIPSGSRTAGLSVLGTFDSLDSTCQAYSRGLLMAIHTIIML